MTTPIDPIAALDYNARVSLAAALALDITGRKAADVEAVLRAHLAGGGSLTPPSSPEQAPPSPGAIKLPVISCPSCLRTDLRNYGSAHVPGGVRRYYICRDCGRNFRQIVLVQPLNQR